jgi:hypothetical protein
MTLVSEQNAVVSQLLVVGKIVTAERVSSVVV